jgi:hypothetical protein
VNDTAIGGIGCFGKEGGYAVCIYLFFVGGKGARNVSGKDIGLKCFSAIG